MIADEKLISKIMREILVKIDSGEDYKSLCAIYGNNDVHEALGRCCDNSIYVANSFAKHNENGVYLIDMASPLKLTKAGRRFIGK